MFDIYYYGRNAGRLSMIKNLTLWETTKELNFSGAIDFNGIFELADSETPALLIIDLEYEDPNYYDLLDRVIGSHLLPSILFTKDNSFNGARHLFLLGADDCLPSGESQKISESRLSQSIVHVCRNHESQIFSNEMNDLISTLTETIFAGKNDCSPIVLGIIEQFYQKYSDSVELRIALAKTFVYIYQLILQKKYYLSRFLYLGMYQHSETYISKTRKEIEDGWCSYYERIRKLYTLFNIIDVDPATYRIGKYTILQVDKDPTLQDIARDLHMNPNYISHVFHEKTGVRLRSFILMTKMERAKDLLHFQELKIGYIADLLGYESVSYFGKLFHEYAGMSPLEYKNSLGLSKKPTESFDL